MRREVRIAGSRIVLGRTAAGTAEITATDEAGFARGTGYVHARDRGRQLLVLRLVGRGRLAEVLAPGRSALASDAWFRRAGFAGQAEAAVAALDPDTAVLLAAYCQGVAAGFTDRIGPLRALGVRPRQWTPADCLLLVTMLGWVGQAQTGAELAAAVVRALHGGADPDLLTDLFGPYLAGLDASAVGWVRGLAHLPEAGPPGAPRSGGGSNAWAVAGDRTAGGGALLAADPHVDIARLPGVWCELVGRVGDGPDRVGVGVPGVPGLVMGRSGGLAWALVSGYADQVTTTVERVSGGRVARPGGDRPVVTERMSVHRRFGRGVEVWAHRSDAGLLAVPPGSPVVPDGLVPATHWSGGGDGAARSVRVLAGLPRCTTVEQARELVSRAALSANWVLADAGGAVGLQQSGTVPRRHPAGRGAGVPRAGWLDGPPPAPVARAELARETDPPAGFVATANEARNPAGGPRVVGVGGPGYRVDRIREVLGSGPVDLDTCRALQADVVSGQARVLVPVLRPMLPDTPAGRALADWDLRDEPGSVGAGLFDRVLAAVRREVFGPVFGERGWDRLARETAVVASLAGVFDEVLLAGDGRWWGPAGRAARLAPVVAAALADPPTRAHGVRLRQADLVLGGVVSALRRAAPLPGGPATVHQVQRVRGLGRPAVVAPSWRMVTDLSTPVVGTALPGGATDRPTSRWYRNRLRGWLGHRYDEVELRPDTARPRAMS